MKAANNNERMNQISSNIRDALTMDDFGLQSGSFRLRALEKVVKEQLHFIVWSAIEKFEMRRTELQAWLSKYYCASYADYRYEYMSEAIHLQKDLFDLGSEFVRKFEEIINFSISSQPLKLNQIENTQETSKSNSNPEPQPQDKPNQLQLGKFSELESKMKEINTIFLDHNFLQNENKTNVLSTIQPGICCPDPNNIEKTIQTLKVEQNHILLNNFQDFEMESSTFTAEEASYFMVILKKGTQKSILALSKTTFEAATKKKRTQSKEIYSTDSRLKLVSFSSANHGKHSNHLVAVFEQSKENPETPGVRKGRFGLVSTTSNSKTNIFMNKCELEGLPQDWDKITFYCNASKLSQDFFCVLYDDCIVYISLDTSSAVPKLESRVLLKQVFSTVMMSDPSKPFNCSLADFDMASFRATQPTATCLLTSLVKRGTSEIHFFLVDLAAVPGKVSLPYDPVFEFNSNGSTKALLNYELFACKGKLRALLVYQVPPTGKDDPCKIVLEFVDLEKMGLIIMVAFEFYIALEDTSGMQALITYNPGSREEHGNYSVIVWDNGFKLFCVLEDQQNITCKAMLERANQETSSSNSSKKDGIAHRLKVIEGNFVEETSTGEFNLYKLKN